MKNIHIKFNPKRIYPKILVSQLRSYFFVCLLIGIWAHTPVWASQPYSPQLGDPLTESWRWTTLPSPKHPHFQCAAEDTKHNMWFGDTEGAHKFDGFHWAHYDSTQGLVGSVQTLYQAPKGSLYAGTPNGLFTFQNDQWVNVLPTLEPLLWQIEDIKEAADKSLWCASNWGLLHIAVNQITLYAPQQIAQTIQQIAPHIQTHIIPNTAIDIITNTHVNIMTDFINDASTTPPFKLYRILIDQEGNVLCTRESRDILKYMPSTNTWYSLLQGHESDTWPSIAQTPDGTIWTASENPRIGVRRFDGQAWHEFSMGPTASNNVHTALHVTRNGYLWVLGHKGFLYVFDGQQWQSYTKPQLPVERMRIYDMVETSTGAIWFVYGGGAPIKVEYGSNRWVTFLGLNFKCEDENGSLWFISADSGVVQNNKGVWTRYGQTDGLMEAPRTLIATKNGIWAGGTHQRVATTAQFNGQSWEKTHHPKLSWNIPPNGMFEAQDGTIWIGADVDFLSELGQIGGIKSYHPKTKQWHHHQPPETPNTIYCITQTADQTVWFGGTAGLYYYRNNTWTQPQNPPELTQKSVDVLHVAHNNKLWVGHRTFGIFQYDGQTWTRYTQEDGIGSGRVRSILHTTKSNIIARTGDTLSRFDGKQWTTIPLPPGMDGFLKLDHEKNLWIYYLDLYKSHKMIPETHAPETEITVTLNTVSQPGNTIISWQGTDYWHQTPQDQLLYSFRLDNQPWSSYTTQTSHILLSLPTGKHTFQVKTRDRDYNKDPTPAKITFTVDPPFWRHPLILSGTCFLVAIIIFQSHRILANNRQLKTTNEALEKRVKERTQALTANEIRYRTLFESAQDGIMLLDKDRFIDCNSRALALFGCEKEQFIGQSPAAFSPSRQPDGQDSIKKAIEKITAAYNGQPQHFEWEHCRLDGSRFQGEVKLNLIEINSQKFLQGLLRDITQHKNAERERERLITDLESKNAELERFTYTVSHDLKSPLVTIKGFLGVLKQDAQTGNKDRLEKDLFFIKNAADNMEHLLDDLLELSRVGRLANPSQEIHMNNLIQESIDLVTGQIQQRNVQINVAENLPTIKGDKQRLREVFQNLIDNAIKFMGEQKNPTIEIGCHQNNDQQIFFVRDNGIGIPPPYHKKVFGLFDRLNPEIDGTGIGLALVQRIIEHHGGQIWVESEGLDKGTTFCFSIQHTE